MIIEKVMSEVKREVMTGGGCADAVLPNASNSSDYALLLLLIVPALTLKSFRCKNKDFSRCFLDEIAHHSVCLFRAWELIARSGIMKN